MGTATDTMPDRTEAADYYFTYIDQAPEGDLCAVLDTQLSDTVELLQGIGDDESLRRYAPGKWSIREVVSHVNDAERLFVGRAFWFARGFDSPLPDFDQEVAIRAVRPDERTWSSHIEEFCAVRAATLAFFRHLPDEAWMRRGIAGGNPFTVRALGRIVAGHVAHHTSVVRLRYLQR